MALPLPLPSLAPRLSRLRLQLPKATLLWFMVALLSIAVMAGVSLRTLKEGSDTADQVDQAYQVAIDVRNVLGAIKDAETGQRGYLLTGNDEYLDVYRQGTGMLPLALRRLRDRVADNPAQLQRIDQLGRLSEERLGEIDNVLRLFERGDRDGALAAVRSNRGKVKMDALRETISEIQQADAALLTQRQSALSSAQQLAVIVTLAGAALLYVFILTAAFTTSNDFRRREREQWLRQSLSDLAAGLQRSAGMAGVAGAAARYLARRCGAAVAAMYVRDAPGAPGFTLRGGVALPDAAPARVTAGHGLLGQCAADLQLTVLDDVPPDHLPLTSAAGRSTPRSLVLCPALFDGEAEALLELGFVAPMREEVPELLRRAEYIIALALRNARERERTELLLEETRQQAEELQTQQEELRVSNEELQAQTQVLQRSQDDLMAQQRALGLTNDALAQRTRDLEAERRRMNEAQAALEAASRYKSEFLANMSHELRTPLNSSLILAKLLGDNREGNLSTEQVKFARAILSSNNDLLNLINDILDLSKIEAGKLDFHLEPVSLPALLQRLRDLFEPLAQQKGLHLAIDAQGDGPSTMVCDEQRVRQVLTNLLSNAVKFTAAGEVTLTVRTGDAGRIAFDVTDTGIGIPADRQSVIFEAFRQADGSTSRRFGGTGLGLTISRELAQRMGGDITVRSAPEEGSCFTVELPLDMRAAAPVRDEPMALPAPATPAYRAPPSPREPAIAVDDDRSRPGRPGRLILAVEDDSAFAEALVSLAHEQDFDCVVAPSASEAIRLAHALHPCGVLLDVGLPDGSGLGVLEQLKRDPATRHVPVHMVSASDNIQTARELGAAGYVLKPATRETLLHAFSDLQARLQQTLRRLLIVEDDASLREGLARMLSTDGLEIVGVSSVREALEQLASQTFDCMVTDLSLPDGSGYDLLSQMASNGGLAFPPVIVYTGRALTRDEEHELQRHSKSIIVKGARSPERLLDEVTLFLHSVEETLPDAQRQMLLQARRRDAVLEGRNVLLAEDDVRNIFALTSVFEPLGVKLHIARNGREAIARLDQGGIDLVLMDIMMPEMDGLTAMRLIRQRPEWRTVPIIGLTAKAMADDRTACLEAGANDYIAKPIDVDKLVSLCRVWCPK